VSGGAGPHAMAAMNRLPRGARVATAACDGTPAQTTQRSAIIEPGHGLFRTRRGLQTKAGLQTASVPRGAPWSLQVVAAPDPWNVAL
jgi:hypothetical protein